MKNHIQLIILVLLILTHFIQLTNNRSKIVNYSNLEYSFNVGVIRWGKLPSCFIKLFELYLSIPDCHTWSSAGKGTIFGKLIEESAEDTISQKVLIKKVNYSLEKNEDSLKNRLLNFINFSSYSFAQRRASVFSNLEEKNSSLLLALLFGQSNALTTQQKALFTQSGLRNLISVSSFTFSLTIESLFLFRRTLSKHHNIVELGSICILGVYILLIGYPLALLRVITGIIIECLSGRIFLRPILPLYRLLLSSLIILACNPYAFFDVGLEFSVLAGLGILLFKKTPTVLHTILGFLPRNWRKRVAQLMWLSVSAQLLTWPLILFYFGEMSLLSPISNVAVSWLLPTILATGMGYWLIGQLNMPILTHFNPILLSQLSIFTAELRFLASLGLVLHFHLNKVILATGYCLITLLLFLMVFNHKRQVRQSFYYSLTS